MSLDFKALAIEFGLLQAISRQYKKNTRGHIRTA